SAVASAPAPSVASRAPIPAPAVPMAEPVAPPAATPPGPQVGALAGSSAERAAAPNEVRFDGASPTGAAAQDKAGRQVPIEVDQIQDPGSSGRASYEKTKRTGQSAAQAELSKLGAATKAAPARPTKPEAVHGIELRTPQLQPKDLADDEKPAGRREG